MPEIRVRTMLEFETATVFFQKIGYRQLADRLASKIRYLTNGALAGYKVTFRSQEMGWLYSYQKAQQRSLRGQEVISLDEFDKSLPDKPAWIVNRDNVRVAFWHPTAE